MSTSPVPAAFRSLSFIDRSARRWTRRVPDGSTLADALRAAGFALDFDCGGRGVCGRCAVPVAFLSDASSFQPRLACRTLVDRDDLLVDVSALPTLEEKRAERLASPLPETTLQPTAEERGGDFGFAVDLGTTTLVCALVSLASGRSLVVSTRRNPQIAWGRDVLSRIGAAVGDPAVAA
ncbi:MAG: 2Fe-2S iron-sulfur cluster binding domain-containing protein, partial [Thermoguttaceae bacterium]|nr:2Fe-2S iron-sulfur cluster binding domain-containing protein [Thermoguttaceae bacterium]